jgi:hypothetical protein
VRSQFSGWCPHLQVSLRSLSGGYDSQPSTIWPQDFASILFPPWPLAGALVSSHSARVSRASRPALRPGGPSFLPFSSSSIARNFSMDHFESRSRDWARCDLSPRRRPAWWGNSQVPPAGRPPRPVLAVLFARPLHRASLEQSAGGLCHSKPSHGRHHQVKHRARPIAGRSPRAGGE